MALLDLIQDAAAELGLPIVSSVISTTDATVRSLLAHANAEGQDLRSEYEWAQLSSTKLITLVAGQSTYPLPDDFDSQIFDTHWDRSNRWQLIGPMSPDEWQFYQSGIVGTTPRRLFRIMGRADNQFTIYPTPSADEAGQILAFEYLSKTWCRPRTWVATTTFLPGAYSYYNGNIYYSSAGGVTGSTAPTHTTGSTSDGGVSWTYISAAYEKFVADTDLTILPQRIIKKGIKWRFRESKGFKWEQLYADYETELKKEVGKLTGASTINMYSNEGAALLGPDNIPDRGYGS